MTFETAAATEPSIPPSTLGNRLRDAREWRELDQSALAEALGVSRATVSNYERGITTPSKLQIGAWAVTCETDVDWLKTGKRAFETPDPQHPGGSPVIDCKRVKRSTTRTPGYRSHLKLAA